MGLCYQDPELCWCSSGVVSVDKFWEQFRSCRPLNGLCESPLSMLDSPPEVFGVGILK